MSGWREKTRNELISVRHSPQQFWKKVKLLNRKSEPVVWTNIDPWVDHFRGLLSNENCVENLFGQQARETLMHHDLICLSCEEKVSSDAPVGEDALDDLHILNQRISENEIVAAMNAMANGKAPGLDGVTIEMFKAAKQFWIPLLSTLFNRIFDTGNYPKEWAKAMICPIHKKGSRFDPTNYRGISLLSVCSKIFTKLLNNRLEKWSEINQVNTRRAGRIQTGLQHDRSNVCPSISDPEIYQ